MPSQCGASMRSPRMRMAVTCPHGVQPIACANAVLISVTPSPVSKRNVPEWPRIAARTVIRWSPNGYGSKWMTAIALLACASNGEAEQAINATTAAERATENRVIDESNSEERCLLAPLRRLACASAVPQTNAAEHGTLRISSKYGCRQCVQVRAEVGGGAAPTNACARPRPLACRSEE